MAALRVFARPVLSAILNRTRVSEQAINVPTGIIKIQERCSSFKSSPVVGDTSKYTDFEVSKNPEEWVFVERILRTKTVPLPPVLVNSELPSGWKPQSEDAKKLPYFVERTKNHMQPVYLHRTYRGTRRITHVRRIQGDIWVLEAELKNFVEQTIGKRIASQVHELAGQINFKGDYVTVVKQWLDTKGL